jgi:hypothetical protein
MARKVDQQNRRADKVNPLRSGMRTGNPQLRTQNAAAGNGKKTTAKPSRKSSRARRRG